MITRERTMTHAERLIEYIRLMGAPVKCDCGEMVHKNLLNPSWDCACGLHLHETSPLEVFTHITYCKAGSAQDAN